MSELPYQALHGRFRLGCRLLNVRDVAFMGRGRLGMFPRVCVLGMADRGLVRRRAFACVLGVVVRLRRVRLRDGLGDEGVMEPRGQE